MGRAGQASKAGLKIPERARKGNWLGFLLWLKGGAKVRVPMHSQGLAWFENSLWHQRREHPGFLLACPDVEPKGKSEQ